MRKIKAWRSRPYLEWVKTQPCVHCRDKADDPHHLMVEGARGIGLTTPDFAAVPVCRLCHTLIQPHAQSYPQLRWLIQTLSQAFDQGVIKWSP